MTLPIPPQASWDSLPYDVLLAIWDHVGSGPAIVTVLRRCLQDWHSEMVDYACVNRSWQDHFEKLLWQRVVVYPEHIDRVERMAPRLKPLVEHLWFRPNGNLDQEERVVPDPDGLRSYVRRILRILEGWDSPDGLIVQLGDTHNENLLGPGMRMMRFLRHPRSAWALGYRPSTAGRVAGEDCETEINTETSTEPATTSPESEPEASTSGQSSGLGAVRGLIIGKSYQSNLFTTTANEVLPRLRNLKYLRYEPWRDYYMTRRRKYPLGYLPTWPSDYVPALLEAASLSPAGLSIYDDFLFDITMTTHPWFVTQISAYYSIAQARVREFGRLLPVLTADLEHFSAGFVIDAKMFLDNCRYVPVWKRLRRLSLTSTALVQSINARERQDIMRDLAHAAAKMPRLEKMELWWADEKEACVFSYDRGLYASEISWKGTWELDLAPLKAAWEPVAVGHTGKSLRGRAYEAVDEKAIECRDSAIKELGLRVAPLTSVPLEKFSRMKGFNVFF